MASKLGYEIVESGTRGKIVIATRDFLPGDTVIVEHDPVLCLSKEVLAEFGTSDMQLLLAGFVVGTKRCEPAKKEKLLALYGPTTGPYAAILREYAENLIFRPDDKTEPRPLTSEEIDTFVHVATIIKLNMFGDAAMKLIYSEITRLAHSCSANCSYHIHGKSIWCQTVRHVSAGEELTISYIQRRDMQPTHIRRQKYLEAKEFTCHCPRCDAPGDDTRQFDCFDPACKGVMMVCQPVNKEALRVVGLQYAGVEYVEPHLLPCTECHRAAPANHQAKMFALEAKLPALVEDIVKRQADMVMKHELGADRYNRLLKEIEGLKLPMRHQLCVPIHDVLVKSIRFQFMDVAMGFEKGDIEQRRAAVHRAACAYIAAQEGVTSGANASVLNVLFQVCSDCIIEWQSPAMFCPFIFTPLQAKLLMQRLLRMQLILRSRTAPRKEDIDNAVLKVLEGLPSAQSTDLCAFCDESPLRAAITLSRCGKCKKVCYCSAGCQMAHWKLHKKTCKAEKK